MTGFYENNVEAAYADPSLYCLEVLMSIIWVSHLWKNDLKTSGESSLFFLRKKTGVSHTPFKQVTLRQHRSLPKRKWQEQDVQIISNVRRAVPRHVSLHSLVLMWGLRAHVGALLSPSLLIYSVGDGERGLQPLSISKVSNGNIQEPKTTLGKPWHSMRRETDIKTHRVVHTLI